MGDKSLTNKYLYRQFSNSASEMFDYTMTNIMDGFYNSSMNSSTDGKFKAVCLSGIKTEDGSGAGTDVNDAEKRGNYVNIIVRPLTDFGNIIPDPRENQEPEEINELISLHASTFLARSDYEFKDTDAIHFGQVVDCYFEEGSIYNSDFRTMRFAQPEGELFDLSFQQLSLITGVETMSEADWTTAGLLGEEVGFGEGKCTNIQGSRPADQIKYIVIHYSAAWGGKKVVLETENEDTVYGYHFMIDRDGSFYISAEPESLIFHAGGNKLVDNDNSIGVCLMNVGFERKGVRQGSRYFIGEGWVEGSFPNGIDSVAIRYQNGKVTRGGTSGMWESYPKASIDQCAKICAELCVKYNIPVSNIVGHSDIQSDKSDPGPAFGPMASFRATVESLMTGKNLFELAMDDLNDSNPLPRIPTAPPGISTGYLPTNQAPAGISTK